MTRTNENGATAATVAIMLLVIMGVAAVAVDLSAGFNERRQDQTASDLAAVAGALSSGDDDEMVEQAMAVARLNIDTVYSDAAWDSLWTACSDPDKGADFTPITHSTLGTIDCISQSPDHFRVRLPTQLVDTAFGKVIGFDNLSTSAYAVVSLNSGNGAGALPFAIRGNAASGEVCLDTSTGSKIVFPCDGNEQGSFGNIAPPLFGNTDLGTSPACSGQTASGGYIAESIAMGIDHALYTMSSADWSAGGLDPDRKQDAKKNNVDPFSNLDECIDNGGPVADPADGTPINAVAIDTGNSVKSAITEGLMTGGTYADGLGPRLTRSGPTRDIDGYDLDNVPLWDHLVAVVGPGAPSECEASTYSVLTITQKNDRMRACLTSWSPGDGQIFQDTIMTSSRLGSAPRIWFNVYPSGVGWSPVKSLDIIYVHSLWFDDKDDTVFHPGDGTSSVNLTNFKDIQQVTAFLLEADMVSQAVRDGLAGLGGGLIEPEITE